MATRLGGWRTSSKKLTWPFNHSIRWSLDKRRTLYFHLHNAYCYQTWRGVLSAKSYNPVITWTRQVTQQIKNVISPFPRDLPSPILTGWWLVIRSYKLQSHISFWQRGHVKSREKQKLYISTSTRPKLTGWWFMRTGHHPQWPHDIIRTQTYSC